MTKAQVLSPIRPFFLLGGSSWTRIPFLSLALLIGPGIKPDLALAQATSPAKAEGSPAPGRVSSISLRSTPLVISAATAERQLVIVEVNSGGLSNATVWLESSQWPQPVSQSASTLPAGKARVELTVPVAQESHPVRVTLTGPEAFRMVVDARVEPPRKWTIYLTQHTHTDIGYTRPQTEILPEHLRYIDYALDYCDLTDGYPDDAKFRWTCETSWAVREYLQRRPPEQIQRLKKRVQEGRIEVAGMLLNMSEIATESSLAASLQPLRAIKSDWGVPVVTAMQNDVNGAAWCLVDYFADVGIRYLSMGINQTRSILPFDKPTAFWWESPSGKRILAYRSDHYMTANFWKINEGQIETFKPGVIDYLRNLEEHQYPFDRAGVQFSGYFTDNSPPSTVASDLVKAWNAKYVWPKLRLSTAREFLDYVEKQHGPELAVYRVGWPDWWTDGFGSAARETAASRETHTATGISSALLSMASILGAPISNNVGQRWAAIQDDLMFYDEHTYGAAESISDPLAENSQIQWGEKGSYVWNAVKNSNLLREEAFGLLQDYLPRMDVPTLAVFNTLSWPRSGLAQMFIDHQILPKDKAFRIVDATTHESVAAQPMASRSEGTYWAFWVKDVPPLGYKMLRLEVSDQPQPAPAKPAAAEPVLENRFYSLTIDPRKGAITKWIDRETGRDLVDASSEYSLGQCLYETMPDNREMKPGVFKRTTVREVTLKPGAQGPIWKSLEYTARMDGCAEKEGLKGEIRLYDAEKRVEVHLALRKLPINKPEAVYVAFPFRLTNAKMLYEGQGGLITPGENQLPGSSSDWQTIQSFIALRNDKEQIVWGSEQAPLVQLGDFNLGKWQPVTHIDKPQIYSWVMNNYWFTNFRAYQEGEFKWSYYLTSTRDVSSTFATRFGWGSRVPFVCRVMPAGKSSRPDRPMTLTTLSFAAPNVIIVEARPASSGNGVVFHLREVEGKSVTLQPDQTTTWAEIRQAQEVNVLEEVLQDNVDSVTFKPFEVKFVRVSFAR